jgi:hypothetical protein
MDRRGGRYRSISSRLPRRYPDLAAEHECLLALSINEHRKLHRSWETRASPIAKRHKAKLIAAGHSTGSSQRQNPASRTIAELLIEQRRESH